MSERFWCVWRNGWWLTLLGGVVSFVVCWYLANKPMEAGLWGVTLLGAFVMSAGLGAFFLTLCLLFTGSLFFRVCKTWHERLAVINLLLGTAIVCLLIYFVTEEEDESVYVTPNREAYTN